MDQELADLQALWKREIEAYERTYEKWVTRGKKIVDRYRDERKARDGMSSRMNILWANVETLTPAVFSRLPQPEVSRRFKDRDPVGRVAALIMERCLEYEIQQYDDYRSGITNAVRDRFLPGRGVCWVRYEPHFQAAEPGVQVTEDAKNNSEEVIAYECAPVDYVHWCDFGHTCARTWEEVRAVWRKVYMTRDQLIERFGEEIALGTPLDQKAADLTDKELRAGADRQRAKATVYEIWDRESMRVIWLSKGRSTPLDVRDDPLKLKDFYPCPRPLFAALTTDDLVPIPDFVVYQDQADELDLVCDRIDGLVKALRVVGVYDASAPALRRLLDSGSQGQMIPVDSWAAFGEKGGLKGSVDFLPIDQVAKTLALCYQARDQIKSQIYELTGISDILRGHSSPSETATAQQIKGRYANLRLRRMQEEVARFARDVLFIKAQVICKHFQPETIIKMGGAEQLPEAQNPEIVMQAIQLLKTDAMRNFRIEITADSLTEIDEEAEKQARIEFLAASGAFLEKAVAAAQAAPELMPLLGEMLMFGVRGFKVGRQIEGSFDAAMAQLSQPRPPQQDPAVAIEQQKMQAEMAKEQQRAQIEQTKAVQDFELQKAKMEAEIALKREQAAAQIQLEREKMQAQIEMERGRMMHEHARDIATLESEQAIEKAKLAADVELRREGLLNDRKPDVEQTIMPAITGAKGAIEALNGLVDDLQKLMRAKRKIVVDEMGNPIGIEYEGVGQRALEVDEQGEIIGMGAL